MTTKLQQFLIDNNERVLYQVPISNHGMIRKIIKTTYPIQDKTFLWLIPIYVRITGDTRQHDEILDDLLTPISS